MYIFPYGTVYSKLPQQKLLKYFLNIDNAPILSFFAKYYIALFGYPDVAGHLKYRLVTKYLNPHPSEKILDAGCGNGSYIFQYINNYHILGYGIDARKEKILRAKKINKYLHFDATFTAGLLENKATSKKFFDKIICVDVLEHIKDDSRALLNISQQLKNGGKIIITVPAKGTALDPKLEKDPNFKPKQYEHVRSGYTKNEMKKLLKMAGLKPLKISPYFFHYSKSAVRLQQELYTKHHIGTNILLSPILTLVAYLDRFYKKGSRGLFIYAQKADSEKVRKYRRNA